MAEEKDRLLDADHDYDGIREYDNPLPSWWLYLFYLCIAFAPLYLSYYLAKGMVISERAGVPFGTAWSGARYAAAARAEAEALAAAPVRELSGEELVAFLRAPANAARGEAVFKANCVSCHGEQAQGVIGPNLVDEYWLHGGKPGDLVASVTHGYLDKGMPQWGPILGAEKIRCVVAYILSIQGRQVPNPKPPQGIKVAAGG